jgi:hypothetical protein
MSSAHSNPNTSDAHAARILLVDPDEAHACGVARLLRSVVSHVEVRPTVGAGPELATWDLLVLNYDTVAREDRERVFRPLAEHRKRGRLLVYTAHRHRDELLVLFGTLGLTNLLARNTEVDPEELVATVQKALRRDIFGVEKYFAEGSQTASLTVRSSSQKDEVLAAVRGFAEQAGAQTRFVEQLCTVADELVTNAVYDAPVDHEGRARFTHLHRLEEVTLDPGEEAVATLATDGRRLGISVADPFGSLSGEKVLDYLSKCFRKGSDQIDKKAGGAGLGLYYIFEGVSHFVVNVAPRRRTEVIGLLDVRGKYRDFAARGKSFNVFIDDSLRGWQER